MKFDFDKGSYRDPEGSVFYFEGQVYRTLKDSTLPRMQQLLRSDFFLDGINKGVFINTKLINSADLPSSDHCLTKCLLWHERIEFLSHPYEWTFNMLKDAALLTLDIMLGLLEEGFILKDGTAWNICFKNGQPCFFDILSIDTYQEGQIWDGFSQFLQEFLYPLMLNSYFNIDFQPHWRATQQGIDGALLLKMLSKRHIFKKGVFKYLYLQQKIASNNNIMRAKVKDSFAKNAFPKSSLISLLKDLKSCIFSLSLVKNSSVWADYDLNNTYENQDVRKKEQFIKDFLEEVSPKSVLDLGCNTGHYSRIAAEYCERVVSCDLDPVSVDLIYTDRNPKISTVVMNLMSPSPSIGWRLQERKDIFSRIKVDAFFALALIHHLCITNNVPLRSFVEFLHEIGSCGVLEWVEKTDPMIQFMLRNRKDIFNEYRLDILLTELERFFKIEKIETLNDSNRKLIFLMNKDS